MGTVPLLIRLLPCALIQRRFSREHVDQLRSNVEPAFPGYGHGLRAVIAIPVQNEAERIGACLDALASQSGCSAASIGLVLFLNNCSDGSAKIACERLSRFPWAARLIEVVEPSATAGWARREAMNAAADWLAACGAEDGIILSTDADSRVGPDWVSRNLAHIAAGADAVAGRIVLEGSDAAAFSPALRARSILETAYEALLIELDARLDPEPGNPWPCHWTSSGASLAISRQAYVKSGGVPAILNGEDRALITAVRATGAHVRHAVDVVVVTAGRLEGRAVGGTADTIKQRLFDPNSPCDPRLESLPRALARILLRRRLRKAHDAGGLKMLYTQCGRLQLPASAQIALSSAWTFAKAYQTIETSSPHLVFRPLRPSKLGMHIVLAKTVILIVRAAQRVQHAIRRVDTAVSANDDLNAQSQPPPPRRGLQPRRP